MKNSNVHLPHSKKFQISCCVVGKEEVLWWDHPLLIMHYVHKPNRQLPHLPWSPGLQGTPCNQQRYDKHCVHVGGSAAPHPRIYAVVPRSWLPKVGYTTRQKQAAHRSMAYVLTQEGAELWLPSSQLNPLYLNFVSMAYN